MNVVFTGRGTDRLGRFRERSEWHRMALTVGFTPQSNLSQSTSLLVSPAYDTGTRKLVVARNRGITVVSYARFQEIVSETADRLDRNDQARYATPIQVRRCLGMAEDRQYPPLRCVIPVGTLNFRLEYHGLPPVTYTVRSTEDANIVRSWAHNVGILGREGRNVSRTGRHAVPLPDRNGGRMSVPDLASGVPINAQAVLAHLRDFSPERVEKDVRSRSFRIFFRGGGSMYVADDHSLAQIADQVREYVASQHTMIGQGIADGDIWRQIEDEVRGRRWTLREVLGFYRVGGRKIKLLGPANSDYIMLRFDSTGHARNAVEMLIRNGVTRIQIPTRQIKRRAKPKKPRIAAIGMVVRRALDLG